MENISYYACRFSYQVAAGVVASAWESPVVTSSGDAITWESSVTPTGVAGVAWLSSVVAPRGVAAAWESSLVEAVVAAAGVSVVVAWEFSDVETDKGVEDKVGMLLVLRSAGFLSSSRPISFSRVLLNSLETSYKNIHTIHDTNLFQSCENYVWRHYLKFPNCRLKCS